MANQPKQPTKRDSVKTVEVRTVRLGVKLAAGSNNGPARSAFARSLVDEAKIRTKAMVGSHKHAMAD